jgi:hypothetical protein
MRRMYSKKQLEEIAKDYIHEHEDVIANPQVVGTEPLLETISIDGDKYIIGGGGDVTASDVDSEEATSGQVLMANGEGGASWQNLPSDKPIHFIKLTSTTLTEALRTEILSHDYIVVIEYDEYLYYEKLVDTLQKAFYRTPSIDNATNNRIRIRNKWFIISSSSLSFSIEELDTYAITNTARPYNIAGKDNSGNNATAGTVLTADGSGGTSWASVPSELPSVTGNAGKVLQVNSGATGVEWATASGGGGTQLYKHDLTFTNNDAENYHFEIISSSNTSPTSSNIGSFMMEALQVYYYQYYNDNTFRANAIYMKKINNGQCQFIYYDEDQESIVSSPEFYNITNITDTVTTL